MQSREDIREFMKKGGDVFLPSVSVDCIIFGFHDNQLKVLLVKMKHINQWALPEKFTMPELQRLYETILDKKLDRRNFQRKMLGYQILRRLKDTRRGVAHKSPYLYSFDLKKYHKALKEGLREGW